MRSVSGFEMTCVGGNGFDMNGLDTGGLGANEKQEIEHSFLGRTSKMVTGYEGCSYETGPQSSAPSDEPERVLSSETKSSCDSPYRMRSANSMSIPSTEKTRPSCTFPDIAETKRRVRNNISKQQYNVQDLYTHTGIWQWIARHPHFEKLTFMVIGSNAIWIAIDTDLNDADVLLQSDVYFQVAENIFCTFFLFEWLTRFLSFRRLRDGFTDSWFVFDGLMVAMMVSETWIFSTMLYLAPSSGGNGPKNTGIVRVARLLRLSRMFRMARLLRAMPEMLILIKGLLAAARSVFFTLMLLFIIVFVYAICFRQLTAKTTIGDAYFTSVFHSMLFLVVHGTLLLSADYKILEFNKETDGVVGGFGLNLIFFSFILLSAVLLMNMLIGVLCEMVSVVAATEKEEMLVNYVDTKLRQVMLLIDEDGGGTISRDEFMQILDNIDAMRALQEVGVDVVGLVDFVDFIFGEDTSPENARELTLSEFMEVVLQLRGSNTATVKDIVDFRKFVRNEMEMAARASPIQSQLSGIYKSIDALRHAMLDIAPETRAALVSSGSCGGNGHGGAKINGGSSRATSRYRSDAKHIADTKPPADLVPTYLPPSVGKIAVELTPQKQAMLDDLPTQRQEVGASPASPRDAACLNSPLPALFLGDTPLLAVKPRDLNSQSDECRKIPLSARGVSGVSPELRHLANTDEVNAGKIANASWQQVEKKRSLRFAISPRPSAKIKAPGGPVLAPSPRNCVAKGGGKMAAEAEHVELLDRQSWCVVDAVELQGVVNRLATVLAHRTSDLEKTIAKLTESDSCVQPFGREVQAADTIKSRKTEKVRFFMVADSAGEGCSPR
eukprot:TRINITY_DN19214_c1_g1_i2.p1 TRINITY_DN19214_c1_g1~~TRINITY_DN19214_c1_g1_i2.p1  ORF type:complete len:836 (-),score=158.75 TRINITY_DN19214_c1_g1_i2:122-2629(-)